MTIDKMFYYKGSQNMAAIKLDARDLQILKILSHEGRITKSELAKKVNLSATPCWERLKRLERSGIIQSYHAQIALQKIAPHINVLVVLELANHRGENFQLFERTIARFDEITSCWAIGGGFDYFLKITTKDIQSYQALIDQLLAEKIGIDRYFTYVITKSVKVGGFPPLDLLVDDDTSS
jgi:Lrp/AsnC family transcriptional regulator of ectoine degradation